MADRIETTKEIALLGYQDEKENIEPEDAQAVEEERFKIRLDMEQQAKGELVEIDGVTFEQAVVTSDVELENVFINKEEFQLEKMGINVYKDK